MCSSDLRPQTLNTITLQSDGREREMEREGGMDGEGDGERGGREREVVRDREVGNREREIGERERQ